MQSQNFCDGLQLQAEGHVNGVYSKGNFCTPMPVPFISSQSHSKERSEERIEFILTCGCPRLRHIGGLIVGTYEIDS